MLVDDESGWLTPMAVTWELDKHKRPALKSNNAASLLFTQIEHTHFVFCCSEQAKAHLSDLACANDWLWTTKMQKTYEILTPPVRKVQYCCKHATSNKLLRRPNPVKTIHSDSWNILRFGLWWWYYYSHTLAQGELYANKLPELQMGWLDLITLMGGRAWWQDGLPMLVGTCWWGEWERGQKKRQLPNTFLFRGMRPTLT